MITFDNLLAYMLGMVISGILLMIILNGWAVSVWKVKRFFNKIRNSVKPKVLSPRENGRPPLGVIPKYLWLEDRYKKVESALLRQKGSRNKELEDGLEDELNWLALLISRPSDRMNKVEKKEPLKERLENLGVN